MTVAFVALGIYRDEGGIERFNRRLVSCLAASAHRAHAIALWDRAEDAAASPPGVSFVACERGKLRALAAFLRVLRSERPDVVVYGHRLLAPLALLTRLSRRRPVNVVIAHGQEVWERPPALRRRLVSAAADRVAAVSDYTAARMAEAYGIDRARFLRVVNAADAADEPPPRRERAGDRLLVVSRLDPAYRDKHVDKVVLAMPRILEAVPGAHLYVAGDGPWRADLEDLAASAGVAGHVHFLGPVSDDEREELYATSDVFVLPSTREGFGIVYLEAWRHSLPVVAGAGGAAPEVVRDGVEGLVVEPEPAAIAGAAIRLLGDGALRRRLGDAGHRRLVESYTPRHFDTAILAMLEDAAAS